MLLEYNVALPPDILSRFDLVYVMIDDPDEQTGYHIAQHIVRVHQKHENALASAFTTAQLKRYMSYAKTLKLKCMQLSPEAKELLVESYVSLRRGDMAPGSRVAYHMTVKQVEAIIRLLEAIARSHLDTEVQPRSVRLAVRLLKTSIISVELSDIDLSEFQDEYQGTDDGMADNGESVSGQAKISTGAATQQASETGESFGDAGSRQGKKLVISDEYFQRVTQVLVMRLRLHEVTIIHEGTGLAGMRQRDLIQWYVNQQNEKNNYSSMEEAAAEVKKVKAIIESLIRREGHLIVVDDGRQAAEEAENVRSSSRDDRILAVAPNYVVD